MAKTQVQTPTPAQLPYLWDVEVGRGNLHMPRPAHLLWEGLWDQLDGLSLTGPVLTEDTPYPTGPTHTPTGHPRREFSHNQLLTTAAHPTGCLVPGKGGRANLPSEPTTAPATRGAVATGALGLDHAMEPPGY